MDHICLFRLERGGIHWPEVKKPAINLPKALFAGTVIVILLYILLNFIFVYALSSGKMEGVISIGGVAVKQLFGSVYDRMSLVIIIVLFSTISSLVIIGPRVYYAMAQKGHFSSLPPK